MSFFDCFVETILTYMVHIKLVISKLGNEVFDYPQVSTNAGQVEGITMVLKDKVTLFFIIVNICLYTNFT